VIEFGDFRFEPAIPLLTRNTRSVEIAPKALEILAVLVENAGQVVGKDDLLSIVWPDQVVEEGNLAVYISALRKVLGETGGRTAYIETIPKRGYRFATPVSRPPSVAVLPFDNLSPEPDTEYFNDGLTEELIHGLTKLDGLMVVAWSSAARLRGQLFDVREIGRQLNVSAVLLGSIRTSGEHLRVMTQLVDTADGRYLWSETYDRQVKDLFAIQEEISRAIVKTLRIKLMDRPGAPAIRQGNYNLEAYNFNWWGDSSGTSALSKGSSAACSILSRPSPSIPPSRRDMWGWRTLTASLPNMAWRARRRSCRPPRRTPRKPWRSTRRWPKRTRRWP
jgi:TolB-like protein